MKKILLIVLPLLLIVGCSKPVEESTLINKDGLMYLPDSDSPYSGEVYFNYDTGEKLYQGTYENGLLVTDSYLNKDGSVKEPINYETTLVERMRVYYTKDTNKPYTGQVFSLYDDGKKKDEGTLKDGKMISKTEFEWYWNGQKKEEGKYKGVKEYPYYVENGLWTEWYKNGQKEREGTYKDGKKDGKWTEWYENGQKERERTYKDGEEDGLWTTVWYENGQKRGEGNWQGWERDGLWSYWYEDGREIIPIIPEFVAVEGGTFQMGSNNGYDKEKPVHSITVSDFNISKTEVTFEQYDVFCDATGSDKPDDEGWGRGDRPVINVSWYDAVAFCGWMKSATGKTYRLPTEAEWEYAARGGNKSKGYEYSGSNDFDAVGWAEDNSGDKTHPVAQKQPNELGLYDMSGNVREWCSDWYDEDYYSSSPQTDPQGPIRGSSRVKRGGDYDYISLCRVAHRTEFVPGYGFNGDGFRLVLSQDSK